MLQLQAHTWADVAYQAVLSLGPALITAGVSWLAFRNQLKLKERELEAQAKLRARELKYNSYQGSLERLEKEAVEIGRVLGELGVAFQVQGDPLERAKLQAALMGTLGKIVMPLRGLEVELEAELERLGIAEKYKAQMAYIKQHIGVNFTSPPVAPVPEQFEAVMTLLSYYSLIQQAITEKKKENLFKDYLHE